MTSANRVTPDSDIVVIVLPKLGEKYIFMVGDSPVHVGQALRTMGRFAADPALSFTWVDAAALAEKLRTK